MHIPSHPLSLITYIYPPSPLTPISHYCGSPLSDVSIDSRHPSLSRILANMRYQIIVLELLRDDYLMRLRIVSGQCDLYAKYRIGTHRLPEDVLLYSTTAGEAKCLHMVSTMEKVALLRANNCTHPHPLDEII